MARKWGAVRAQAVREGRLNEQNVAAHKARLLAQQRHRRKTDHPDARRGE